MKLILIAALNKNRVIGKNGKIPWHIPEDLQRFKQLTIHHTVLMGRKTFESIGTPLLNRKNVVISKQKIASENIEIYSSLESALSHLHTEEQIFIIGGGEIFRQTIDLADELLLTMVDNDELGDTFFPEYEHLIGRKFVESYSQQMNGFQFRDYKRSSV